VEEIVSIDTDHPVLGRYVELVTALSAAHGTDLLVGARLAGGAGPLAGAVEGAQVVAIAPDVATVAGLFALNLTQWRTDAWAATELDPAELDELHHRLRQLAGSPADRVPPPGTITWHHAQVAYRRGV